MTYSVLQVHRYRDTRSGDFSHRIRDPGEALSRGSEFAVADLHLYHPLFPDLALKADLVVLHLLHQPEITRLIHLRRKAGLPTVFEIPDDFTRPWQEMGEGDPHRNPYIRQNFLHHASLCDGLQCSSQTLVDDFGFLNPNHRVFPNQVRVPDDGPSPRGAGFVVGWGGSLGHREDLAWVAPTIKAFCKRHADACFAFMGSRGLFDELFGDLPTEKVRYREPGGMDDWLAFIDGLHVGLAPLRDTPFNRARSDGKYLEYAAFGAAPLVSDMPNYQPHRTRARMFTDLDGLDAALEELYASPDSVRTLAARAHDYVRTERSEEAHVRDRLELYRSLMTGPPAGAPFPDLPACAQLIQRVQRGHDALSAEHLPEALRCFQEAYSAHPDYHHADFQAMRVLNALGDGGRRQVLELYASWQPHPVYSDLYAEQLFLAAEHMLPDAVQAFLDRIEDPVRRDLLYPPTDEPAETTWRRILSNRAYDYHALTHLRDYLARRVDADPAVLEDLIAKIELLER